MSDQDSNIDWSENMNIVFGKYGWRYIPYYRIGERKMVEIPKDKKEEVIEEVVTAAEIVRQRKKLLQKLTTIIFLEQLILLLL